MELTSVHAEGAASSDSLALPGVELAVATAAAFGFADADEEAAAFTGA